MAREVDVNSPDAALAEALRWAASHKERLVLRDNGRAVAEIVPAPEEAATPPPTAHWPPPWVGLFADHPEVCDAIDEVYRDRQRHMPPPPPDLGPGDDGEP